MFRNVNTCGCTTQKPIFMTTIRNGGRRANAQYGERGPTLGHLGAVDEKIEIEAHLVAEQHRDGAITTRMEFRLLEDHRPAHPARESATDAAIAEYARRAITA